MSYFLEQPFPWSHAEDGDRQPYAADDVLQGEPVHQDPYLVAGLPQDDVPQASEPADGRTQSDRHGNTSELLLLF